MLFNKIAIVVCIGALNCVAGADVTTVGPFTGTFNDTFNQHNNVMAVQALPVFGGIGALENLDDGGAIKVEFSSSLGGDLVTPLSDMMAGQLGVAQWVFDMPMMRFGGWWENNSGVDDATVVFYDAFDNIIDTVVADTDTNAQSWTWNGWESDTPFSRIMVTGNGLINGFIWYENMQADPFTAPAPSALALLCTAALLERRRRGG